MRRLLLIIISAAALAVPIGFSVVSSTPASASGGWFYLEAWGSSPQLEVNDVTGNQPVRMGYYPGGNPYAYVLSYEGTAGGQDWYEFIDGNGNCLHAASTNDVVPSGCDNGTTEQWALIPCSNGHSPFCVENRHFALYLTCVNGLGGECATDDIENASLWATPAQ